MELTDEELRLICSEHGVKVGSFKSDTKTRTLFAIIRAAIKQATIKQSQKKD